MTLWRIVNPSNLTPWKVISLKQELVTNALANQNCDFDRFRRTRSVAIGRNGGRAFLPTAQRHGGVSQNGGTRITRPKARRTAADRFANRTRFRSPDKSNRSTEAGSSNFVAQRLSLKTECEPGSSHLVQCAADPSAERETVLIGSDEVVTFSPLKNASAIVGQAFWRSTGAALAVRYRSFRPARWNMP